MPHKDQPQPRKRIAGLRELSNTLLLSLIIR